MALAGGSNLVVALLATIAVVAGATQPANGATCTVSCTGLSCACSVASGTCDITTGVTVPAGAVLDCTGRALHVKGTGGFLRVLNGFATLRATDLIVNAGRSVRAERTLGTPPYGWTIALSGVLDLSGYLSARSNSGGGRITVQSGTDILVRDDGGQTVGIDAGGTAPDAEGGVIRLRAGRDVDIDDPLRADTPAGSVGIAPGGEVSIVAGRNVFVDQEINVFGRQDQGGTISLTAQGVVATNGQPLSQAQLPACGSTLMTGKVLVNSALRAEGGNTEASGGEIEILGRHVEVNAPLAVQGGVNASGGEATGGIVSVESDCDVAINANIDVTSGSGGPGLSRGALSLAADRDITVGNGVSLLGRSDANGGDGAGVSIEAERNISIGTGVIIDTRGHTSGGNDGAGALIELSGCAVSVGAGSQFDARGLEAGSVAIVGRQSVTVAGGATMNALAVGSGGANGTIEATSRVTGRCSNDPTRECSTTAQCPGGTCTLAVAFSATAQPALVQSINRSLHPCD